MRHLEPLLLDYQRTFDAWESGGVKGLVIGPLKFEGNHLAYEPQKKFYKALGVPPIPSPRRLFPGKRKLLDGMLAEAADRGWKLHIFEPSFYTYYSNGREAMDEQSILRDSACVADTMSQFPMAHGCLLDGPEWGYEITPGFQRDEKSVWVNQRETARPFYEKAGIDFDKLPSIQNALWEKLHHLEAIPERITWQGGPFRCPEIFGDVPDLPYWLEARIRSHSYIMRKRVETVRSVADRHFEIGLGLRTPAFAGLCGVDLKVYDDIADFICPKHYFFHRGFDGLYGTVGRFIETLVEWNPELDDQAAIRVIEAIFGFRLPGVRNRLELDYGFPDEFFQSIVKEETRRSLSAVSRPEKVIPWVDAGRRPHCGDPFTAVDLRRTILASAEAGLKHFIYHNHDTLTMGNWQVLSTLCGKSWMPSKGGDATYVLTQDEYTQQLRFLENVAAGYVPPDRNLI